MARYRRVPRKAPVERTPTAPATPDLESLLKADLVALAEQRGVDTSGTKADLVERLRS